MDLKLLESVMRAFCPQTSKGHFNVPEAYNFKGAVFDLDGVVTQTAGLHEESWKRLFDEFLSKRRDEGQAQGDGSLKGTHGRRKAERREESAPTVKPKHKPANLDKDTDNAQDGEPARQKHSQDLEEGKGGKESQDASESGKSAKRGFRENDSKAPELKSSEDTATTRSEVKADEQRQDKESEERPGDEKASDPYRPFEYDDYLRYVDGRPRIDGIISFLTSRGIELPRGKESDDEDQETVYALGNKKNRLFNELLKDRGVEIYKSTVELIKELRRMGVKIGVASSSKNCKPIMIRSEIEHLFSVVIDGLVSESLGLNGKPAPDIFTKCAEMLGVHPHECIMVEDATSGVAAGKAGGFGLVIGIDRAGGNNREALLKSGADLVLDDFAQINTWHLNDFFLPNDAGYVLQFDGYEPKQERLREALCTLGNGYFATRGSLDESRADENEHYPGTYMARGWNREISKVEGRDVANEDLVNLPNWTYITFRVEGEDWFSWTRDANGDLPFELLHYEARLDVGDGVLVRRYRIKDKKGRMTMIMSHRVVHMKKPHLGMIKYTLIPENWGGQIELASELDGSVRNRGVPRYLGLNDKHLLTLEKGKFPISPQHNEPTAQGIYIVSRFTKASCEIAMAARNRLYRGTSVEPLDNDTIVEGEDKVTQIFAIDVEPGCIIQLEKLVSVYCSKDRGVGNVAESAIDDIQRHHLKRYYNLFSLHQKIKKEIWRRIDIDIELTPEEASPKLRQQHMEAVKKERRELRVLNGSQDDPTSEDYFRSLTGTTMNRKPMRTVAPKQFKSKPVRNRSEMMSKRCYQYEQAKLKMERIESHALIKFSDIIKAKTESELLATASKYLQFVLRFNAFHLSQTVSFNTIGLDTSIPARGLHGESYRGHIFWDELFVFPVFNLRLPEVARTLLLYRFYRLDAARDRAKQLGYFGACYPWQSSSTGKEETQEVHYNPINKTWGPDYSSNQLHVNIAIFYNIWDYYNVTGDRNFIALYGAEMMLEIARFWGLKCTYNEKTDRYDIDGVMGPDEFHEKYPDSDKPGLKNNAYTNVMVAWLLDKALRVLEELLPAARRQEMMSRLHLSQQELDRWEHITFRMTVPFLADCPGVIAQFEGWDELLDLDWDAYRKKYGAINRLDRILKSEGDSPDRYKLAKQADTCMLFYLLPEQELLRIMSQLGYPFTRELIHRNIRYYLEHTSHGSTLSYVVFAHILHKFDPKKAWKFYRIFAMSDIADTQGGTTCEGIHVVPMAASINMLLMQFCGIDTSYNAVRIDPHLIKVINRLAFRFSYQEQWIRVKIADCVLTVAVDGDLGKEGKVPILIGNSLHFLLPGSKMQFHLP